VIAVNWFFSIESNSAGTVIKQSSEAIEQTLIAIEASIARLDLFIAVYGFHIGDWKSLSVNEGRSFKNATEGNLKFFILVLFIDLYFMFLLLLLFLLYLLPFFLPHPSCVSFMNREVRESLAREGPGVRPLLVYDIDEIFTAL